MHDTIAEWQLPPERAGCGADSDLAARRQMFAASPSPYPLLEPQRPRPHVSD
jgi:hypothetical protein